MITRSSAASLGPRFSIVIVVSSVSLIATVVPFMVTIIAAIAQGIIIPAIILATFLVAIIASTSTSASASTSAPASASAPASRSIMPATSSFGAMPSTLAFVVIASTSRRFVLFLLFASLSIFFAPFSIVG